MKKATLNFKVEQVNEALELFKASESAVVIDYLGLNVAEVSELRRNLYNAGCELRVIKNNILRRAANEEGFGELEKHLVGPSAIIVSKDEVSGAKVVYDFLKDHEKLSVKAGIVDKKITSEAELKALSSLPNKDGMISMLLSVMQAPIRGLACAIKAVSEKE